MDLFAAEQTRKANEQAPLAWRMRPRTLDEYAGQEALISEGQPLRRMVESGVIRSMILWGPPGVGKTTLAELLAEASHAHLERLSAVMAGVKDIRDVVERAHVQQTQGRQTLLFLDEIHRLNKSQQDALLPHVESGTLVLIGATTENPSFEVNSALLSRARVYVLKQLTDAELAGVLRRALNDSERGLGQRQLIVSDEVLNTLAHAAQGDARRALGLLETATDFTVKQGEQEYLDESTLHELIGHHSTAFDKNGDAYYDLLSAIHKSIRSSRPDAALLYIARYIRGGGDPLDVIRRLAAIATEDVGNTDPRALPLVMSCWDSYLRLGDHEGQRSIAQAAIYLAVAPKSNAVYMAWKKAQTIAEQYPNLEVPLYLRNAPTELMASLGHGTGYRYAHDEPHGYPAGDNHDCWPEHVPKTALYKPTEYGAEKRFKEIMQWRKGRDQSSSS